MSDNTSLTKSKKDKRFEIRLTENTYNDLVNCAEKLNISKSAVIHKGIDLVKQEIEK